jgi:catechol O-methyltransferase
MMHVGDVKGKLLDAEMDKCKPHVVVELGGYVGYSALRIARKLPSRAHLYSVEIAPLYAAIATKILEFAGLRDRVSIIVGMVATKIDHLRRVCAGGNKIDLLFLDHHKAEYLPDLQRLEAANLLGAGSVVVADNCLYPGCPDLVAYLRDTPARWASVCHKTTLEYRSDARGSRLGCDPSRRQGLRGPEPIARTPLACLVDSRNTKIKCLGKSAVWFFL